MAQRWFQGKTTNLVCLRQCMAATILDGQRVNKRAYKSYFLIANVTAAICILTIRVVDGTRFRSFGHERCACYAQFTRPDSTKLF